MWLCSRNLHKYMVLLWTNHHQHTHTYILVLLLVNMSQPWRSLCFKSIKNFITPVHILFTWLRSKLYVTRRTKQWKHTAYLHVILTQSLCLVLVAHMIIIMTNKICMQYIYRYISLLNVWPIVFCLCSMNMSNSVFCVWSINYFK